MEPPPWPDRWDVAAWTGAVGVLAGTHLLVADVRVRYAAWLAVFSVWMGWFVYYGTRWLYGSS